jgi:glyoxylase-like metal-dependent hydrolase (beta-lactamase superfamily II)
MIDYEKAANDLYFIKQPLREGWFFGVTVVLGATRIGLVDTGFENTPVDRIFSLVQELGRRPEEIDYVVNTHRDGDHVLGNKVIKERTKATIAIHELEAEAVETADVKLQDGDRVELGDRAFTVIHTLGHRPGSICLYDVKNHTLITGDSVCGDRTDLIRMDKEIYISSLKKLLDLDTRLLIMSHPFKTLGKSILSRNGPKEMMDASIAIAEELSQWQSRQYQIFTRSSG